MKKISLFITIFLLLIISGCASTSEEVDFNKTKTITLDALSVEVPEIFELGKVSNSEYIYYTYLDDGKYNNCTVSLSKSNYPMSSLKEIVQSEFLDKLDFTYSEKTINGQKWGVGYLESSAKYSQTIYGTIYNGKEYVVHYDDLGSGDDCAKVLSIIEKSIKLK